MCWIRVIANLIRVLLEGVAALPGAGIPDLHCLVTRPASVSIALGVCDQMQYQQQTHLIA